MYTYHTEGNMNTYLKKLKSYKLFHEFEVNSYELLIIYEL